MAAFESLTQKLGSAFKKLRGKGRLKESDVKEAMREIRMALLEADVCNISASSSTGCNLTRPPALKKSSSASICE